MKKAKGLKIITGRGDKAAHMGKGAGKAFGGKSMGKGGDKK